MRHRGTGFGAGKVILLGEHGVVHGFPAIAAALTRGVEAVAHPAEESSLYISPWNRRFFPRPNDSEPLSRALWEVLSHHESGSPLEIEAHVSLPPGAGLGCSAALGVAVVEAVGRAVGFERSRLDLAAHALRWERHFHGDPSGIDNAVAAVGGTVRFERGHGFTSIAAREPLHLVIANSGQSSDTKDMVARVASLLAARAEQTRGRLEEIGALVREGECAIERGDLDTLGECLDHNHAALRTLGLSTPRIEALVDMAKSAGARGAKVTGAGGGGCIVALARDAAHAASLANALQADTFVEEVPHAA